MAKLKKIAGILEIIDKKLSNFSEIGYGPYCTGNPLQMDLAENLHTYVL